MAILKSNSYNISKKIEAELREVRKKYVSKIARVNNNNEYGTKYVPTRPKTINQIKASVNNGYELRNEIRKMQAYLKRNAEKQSSKNENLSNYEYEELKKLKRKAMRKLNEEINFYENTDLKILGETTNNRLNTMGDKAIENKYETRERVRNSLKDLTSDNIKETFRLLEAQSRKTTKLEAMKENYITMLDTLGKQAGVSKENRDNIANKINSLNAKDFYNVYISDTSVKILMEQYDVYRDKIKKGRKYSMADKSKDKEYFDLLSKDINKVINVK